MVPPCGFTRRKVLVSWVSSKIAATRRVPDQGRRGTAGVGEAAGAPFEGAGGAVGAEAGKAEGGGGAPGMTGGGPPPEGVNAAGRLASRETRFDTRRMRAKWISRVPRTNIPRNTITVR